MYIDPAFGGMLLQVVLGIIAVGGALVYSLKRRAQRLLGKENPEEAPEGADFAQTGPGEMVDTLAEAALPDETGKE